jgi:hypothetical protein
MEVIQIVACSMGVITKSLSAGHYPHRVEGPQEKLYFSCYFQLKAKIKKCVF